MTLDFTGHSFEETIILLNVKWHLSYPLSNGNLEEMMEGRGVDVDHTTNIVGSSSFPVPSTKRSEGQKVRPLDDGS